ncbi:MAG: V-type ATP synthase subunit E [Methanoregula sp. PtaU1.Bin051]|nr:MAG: V-type ATP synthase subunit E [Methanoregula sp. PtaU1.Bin051]
MAEEIRDLIEKINAEGVRAAEEKARAIEAAAQQRAGEILTKATAEAEAMIAAAQERIRRDEEKERVLLSQAGRDLLLSLREEINAMLGRIVVSEVRDVLTPEVLARLITESVRNYSAGKGGDITVSVNAGDLEVLENHFLTRLREETKKTIVLRPSEEISGGFSISFDDGKSCHDFTDKALAAYIGTHLKPRLNRILEGAMKE